MKLELKHIAPYLPYKLKCQTVDKGEVVISELNAAYSDNSYTFMNIVESEKGFEEIKPILRPLSDLTKEITHSGKTFTPINYNAFKHERENLINFQNRYNHFKSIKYGVLERLFEWNFDVFGLIDKGLAININEL